MATSLTKIRSNPIGQETNIYLLLIILIKIRFLNLKNYAEKTPELLPADAVELAVA